MIKKRKNFSKIYFNLKNNTNIKLFLVFVIFICVSGISILFFENTINKEQFTNFFDSIWWTIVTITTVGYGEKIPVSIPGKILAISIMFSGMILVGIISGRVASILVERNLKEGRGLGKYSKLNNHFIICGWKIGMEKIVKDILHFNDRILDPSDVIIITDADQSLIDEFKSIPEFDKIKIIRGDSSSEEVLSRANIKNANKVLVLATDIMGIKASEVDSKTIMTVMTIKNLSRSIYAIAELLDKNYEKYLKLADCDEILLSSEHSRILLANTSASSGMSHIIYDILDAQTPAAIATEKITDDFLDKPFIELAKYYSENKKILIGVLENTGNAFKMKKDALKEAQKSPDISLIVKNLKETKNIQINKPIINPSNNYIIKKHDMAIIIESREVG